MRRNVAAASILGLLLFSAGCAGGTTDTQETPAATETATATGTETETETGTATESPSPDASPEGDLIETATAAGDFTTFATAVAAAGLTDTLQGDGPFTVFAPTDQAISALPAGTLDTLLAEPQGELRTVLQGHVVPGTLMSNNILGMDGQQLTTAAGDTLTVGVEGARVTLTDGSGQTVNVTQADIEATNGVIHAIDGVLMPSESGGGGEGAGTATATATATN